MAIRRFSARLRAIWRLPALALAACQDDPRHPEGLRPVSAALVAKMDKLGMTETSPILIRIFKEESELEVWKQQRDGKYALLKTYQICKWSGELGPKKVEGDRQAPEGFYTVTPAQMNPKSHYYLSFNIGYPNAYDRALGRTGSQPDGAWRLLVVGLLLDDRRGCRRDLRAGARRLPRRPASFQIQAFPFRMTAENIAKHRDDPNMPFWRMLKVGYDHFEVTRRPPKVDVCDKRYVFDADAGERRRSTRAPRARPTRWRRRSSRRSPPSRRRTIRSSPLQRQARSRCREDERPPSKPRRRAAQPPLKR